MTYIKQYCVLLYTIILPLYSYTQCAGNVSFQLSPVSIDNTYPPGATVELCVTMDGWNGNTEGSNWLEGFGLTLGPGWQLVMPINAPISVGAAGEWIWSESVTSVQTGMTAGPGFFFEGPNGITDSDPGNDWGDFCIDGLCQWQFCVSLTVSNINDPLSLYLGVTPYADGSMGSWINESCFDPTITIFDGNIGCLTFGCIDLLACNYDATIACDNGSCTYPGCTDILACNYNINAGCDDNSCVYPGCTDVLACNYNPNAGCIDGSCSYFSIGNITRASSQCPDTVCINTEVSYSVTGQQSSQYIWYISGGGLLSTNLTNVCNINWNATAGSFSLHVNEITNAGCISDTVSCNIQVIDPHIKFDTTSYTICHDGIISLYAKPIGGTWDSEYMQGNSFTGTMPGSFSVGYTGQLYNCTVKEYITVNVKSKFSQPELISADTAVYVCNESTQQYYKVKPVTGVYYTWLIDNYMYMSQTDDMFIEWYDTTNTYLITVYGIDTLQCKSETYNFYVKTEACTRLYAPNTFSPNNDGVNDIFRISGIGIYYPRLVIIDRWGHIVFETNDMYRGWNGDDGNGYYSKSDIYNWILYYKDFQNVKRQINGYIYLIR